MIFEKVLSTINKYNLIQKGDKIVLGLSGGPDSISMLDILKELKMNGLLLGEEEVISAMDGSLSSIPASFNKDGSFSKRSSIASREQFSTLQNYVKKKIYLNNIEYVNMCDIIKIDTQF